MSELYNNAVPKYYGIFRDKVLRGEIPVNEMVSLEMNRIDRLIESPVFYYDPEGVERYIRFCEKELTLVDGSDMYLLDTYKLWAEQIYGWYYYIDRTVPMKDPDGHVRYRTRRMLKRLVNKQYLILGRGGSKSLYLSTHHAFNLVTNSATCYQMTCAPTMAQADEVVSPIRTALTRARGPWLKFLTMGSLQNTTGNRFNRPQLFSSKKGIENALTNSLMNIRPMSINKTQGMRPVIATVDEWLSGDIKEDVIGSIEQGASKNDDWLIIAASSEGTTRNGPGDTIKMELLDILRGNYYNPHVSIWWYRLDDVKEVADPDTWVKANPNLGVTVTYETYQTEVERAEKAPSVRNDTLAKRFGIPSIGTSYFFRFEETIPHQRQCFYNMQCSLGCDLSQGDDFCSFTFLFPLRGMRFGVKTRNYITSRTYNRLSPGMLQAYSRFLQEGSLIVMEGTVLNTDEIYEDLERHISDCCYDVVTLGYDPYFAKEFIQRWSTENGPYRIEKVNQGARTESVPLGELKKLAEDRALLFDEEMMQFTMGNCVADEDTNGNLKLNKMRYDEKIDSVAAMLDAYVAYKLHKDDFG
jgi:phage terminase large subunit-like protein